MRTLKRNLNFSSDFNKENERGRAVMVKTLEIEIQSDIYVLLNSTNLELCVTYIIIAYIVFLFCHVLYETNSIVSFHIEAKEALETHIVEQ
jgi:hypothetical protein